MRKFLAVIKREYIQRVRTKFFVVATILGPVLMGAFTVVPALMLSTNMGGPTRLAIVDQTGKMYERVATELADGKERRDRGEKTQTPMQPPAGSDARQKEIKQAGEKVQASFSVQKAAL